MPTPLNITLQASRNGGSQQTGGIVCAPGDSIVLSVSNTSGVQKLLYEILDYPNGWPCPSGWTANADGSYSVVTVSGAAAPAFALPSDTSLWGDFALLVTANDGIRDGAFAPDLIDGRTALRTVSSNGLEDTAFGISTQFDAFRSWIGALKKNLRILESISGGSPTVGGDIAGPLASSALIHVTGTGGVIPFGAALEGDSNASEPLRLAVSSISLTLDANHTATATEYARARLIITSTTSLTADRDFVLPAAAGAWFVVQNGTTGGHAIVCKVSGGTGVLVANGAIVVIYFNGTDYATTTESGFTAGGDLSGSSSSQSVIRLHGATIPIAGSLTPGNLVQVTGSSALGYAALNLGGGTNYVTGTLPAANQAAQSMGGDIGGTTAAATVQAITGVSGAAIVRAPLVGDAAGSNPFRLGDAFIAITDADYTASAADYSHAIITITGALTADRNFIVPASAGAPFCIVNATTGGHAVTVKTASGSGVAALNGGAVFVWCDGANIKGVRDGAPFTAAGDLSGSSSSQTVVRITGASGIVPFGAALTGDQSGSNPLRLAGASIVLADANHTATAAEYSRPVLVVTGTLTATRTVTLPATINSIFISQNDTTGGHDVVFGASSGATVTVSAGTREFIYFDGTDYVSLSGTGGGSGITALTGDVTASGTGSVAATVAKIHGATVPIAGSLTTGNVLQVSGASACSYGPVNLAGGANYVTGTLPATNLPDATTGAKGIVQLAGDFAGSATSPLVAKLQGNPVDSTALGAGQDAYVLTWDNTAGKIIAKVAASGFTAAGDLSGTPTSQTVIQIHGATVPIAGSLVTGHGLYVSGSSALSYSALNLAGGSGWVTGVLPAANVPVLSGITAPTADVSLNSHKITSLATPTTGTDAATKAYVDSTAAGLSSKPAALVVATTNITLSGEQTIDGVTTSASRVLAAGQTTASQVGLYVSASGVWTRAPDMPAASSASGAFVLIEQGTLHKGSAWVCTSAPGSDVVGVNSLTFTEFDIGAMTFAKLNALLATANAPIAVNGQKITSLANGTVSTDAAAFGQVTGGDSTTLATAESYTDTQIAASAAGGVFWEAANTAALNAITITSAQVGKFAFKGDDDTLWLSLSAGTGSGHWTEVVGGMLALTGDVVASGTGSVPTQVHALTGNGTQLPVSTPLGGDGTNPLGFDAVAITMTTADYTLSASEYSHNFIDISGTIGATRWLLLPAKKGAWFYIHNGVSDGFNVLAKASGGAGITVPGGVDGGDALCWCYDGTNYRGIRDFSAVIRGDLGGTSTNPTVIAITGVSGTAIVRSPLIGDSANTEPFRFGETGVVFATDADHTATATEYAHPVLGVTSTGSLTATRNLILPAANGAIFVVGNFTTGGQTIIAKTPSGTGVSIPTGSTAVIACDGTNYFGIAAGSGGSDATSWYGVALDPSMASPSGGSYGAVPIFGGAYGSTSWEWADVKFSLFDFSGAITPTEGNLTSWGDKDGNLTLGDSGIVASSVITHVAIGGTWAAKQNLASATQAWLPLGGPNLSSQPSTAIAASSWVAPKPGTINSIYVKYAGAVTIADNIVFNIYINGTDSGHGCTVTGGTTAGNATGLSVNYNAGDLIALGAKQASTAAATNLFITASLAGS